MTRTDDRTWFVTSRPNPRARLRLFCFPYSGGGAFAFHSWADHLPADVEVCAIQLPGRENRLREPLIASLPHFTEALMSALPARLDLPCALFGHSLGALLAFETARTLRRECGITPVHLFASARAAPQCPVRVEPMYRKSDADFVDGLKEFNGTTDAVMGNAELMQMFLPILRADFQLNETYLHAWEPPLDCPITALRGAQDRVVNYDDVAAWRQQTTRDFTLRTLPGGHFFIHQAQHLVWQFLSYDLIRSSESLEVGGSESEWAESA